MRRMRTIFALTFSLFSSVAFATCIRPLNDPGLNALGREQSRKLLDVYRDNKIVGSGSDAIAAFRESFIKTVDTTLKQKGLPASMDRLWQLSDEAFRSCFPALDQLATLADERTQAGKEQEELENRVAAEERQREAARQRADLTPFNVLIRAYGFYIYIKHCYDERSGYMVVYINDQEMDRARSEIKVLSEKIKNADASIDDDSAWKLGDGEARKHKVISDKCHEVLGLLDTAAKAADPEIGRTKKDF